MNSIAKIIKITKHDITAVIIAGGRAMRMGGQDKGLLIHEGQTFVENLIQMLEPQVHTIIINANRNQQIYADLTNYPVLADEIGEFAGPLAGIFTALQAAPTSYIVTVPCDVPHIPSNLVTKLAANLGEQEIAIVHDGLRDQYLFALMGKYVLNSLSCYLQSGQHKVKIWYSQHKLAVVDFSDAGEFFANINTKEDYRQLNKQME